MPPRYDLTGQKFTRIFVLEFDSINKCGQAMWKGVCDCGIIKPFNGCKLRSGETKSCGCYSKDLFIEYLNEQSPDITGQKFTYLTAIRSVGTDSDGFVLWFCKCDCGGQKTLRAASLISKNTKSCGCIRNAIQLEIFNNIVKPICPDAVSEFRIPDRQSIDIAVESLKIAIEYDGRQHKEVWCFDKGDVSKLDVRKARDIKKDKYIKSIGWKILRIPERSFASNPQKWKFKIEAFIKEAQNG